MEIILTNTINIKKPTESLEESLTNLLKVENPKYVDAVNAGRSTYGIKPFIYNYDLRPNGELRIPRGMRSFLQSKLVDVEHTVEDRRHRGRFLDIPSKIKYRPYQERAISSLMSRGEEGILVAPAGSGKTVMGLSLISLFGQKTLWLTHTRALAHQCIERASFFLPDLEKEDIGLIGDGKWKNGQVLDVALIPTLVRRPTELATMRREYGMVILDEAHHCPASTFLSVVNQLAPYYLYGLTATPYRRDKLENVMFQTLGPELVRVSVDDVSNSGGIIMPTVLYRGIRSKPEYGNNIQTILKSLVFNEKRNYTIVGDILREAVAGNYCIVLTDRKAHADILYELISKGWEKTGIATGNYSKKYVSEQAERLNNKEISVLICTFALLGEGFDVKFLNRAFITLPFRAEGKVEQLVGRIQRTAEGKSDAIVYDYVDVDIGVLKNQFYHRGKNDCRHKAYTRLGLKVIPYGEQEGNL